MKLARYRVGLASLLFIAGVINYMDRAALGVAAPFVQKDLRLSSSQLGLVFSTFFIGYAISAFVGGQFADRYGPRRVYTWAATSWSLLCALTGAVTGFGQLFIVRSFFGFAEGPMCSTTNRMITNWFPRRETARAIGSVFSGQTVGSAVAAPIIGLLALNFGWRVAFIAVSLSGLLWVVLWRVFATDLPRENPRVSKAEIELIAADRTGLSDMAGARSTPLLTYLLRPSTLSLGLGLFAMNYSIYIFISWLPSYLVTSLHLAVRQMSFIAAIPWIFGIIGYLGGGMISDLAYPQHWGPLTARKLMTVVPLALAAIALIGVIFAPNAVCAVALIAIAVMLLTSSIQSLWATIHELVPETHVGGVSGFIHMLSNISGIIGPAATGFAIQYFGGYNSAFAIAATLAIIGSIAMALFVKKPESTIESGSSTVAPAAEPVHPIVESI